jgi:hypothetical protein
MCPTMGQSGLQVAREERKRVPWSLLSSQFCSSRLRGRIQSTQPDRVQQTRSASRDSARITGDTEVNCHNQPSWYRCHQSAPWKIFAG